MEDVQTAEPRVLKSFCGEGLQVDVLDCEDGGCLVGIVVFDRDNDRMEGFSLCPRHAGDLQMLLNKAVGFCERREEDSD